MTLAAIGIAAALQTGPVDPCSAFLPRSLRVAITKAYPAFRAVRASDYDIRMVGPELPRHKNGCIGAAAADVNGDGRIDYCLVLTAVGLHRIVIAIASPAGGWRFKSLGRAEKPSADAFFVNVLDAGEYRDMYGADPQYESDFKHPGHVRRYVGKRPGFVVGAIEASAVAYFWTGSRWVFLTLSN